MLAFYHAETLIDRQRRKVAELLIHYPTDVGILKLTSTTGMRSIMWGIFSPFLTTVEVVSSVLHHELMTRDSLLAVCNSKGK
jgi:hypothetical protein